MFARPTASAIALFALLAFWTPFFYLTLVVPGLSLEATPPVVQHRIAGLVIEPQVVVAIIALLLAVCGYRMARRPVAR